MYTVTRVKGFDKALQQVARGGKFTRRKIEEVIDILSSGGALPAHLHDHALKGEYEGSRECHVGGDLLLVYERHEDVLVLIMIDIGTHHKLFGS